MITTHVLDTALGKPGKNIPVKLLEERDGKWLDLASGRTDGDGRLKTLSEKVSLKKGLYRLEFHVGEYLRAAHAAPFYETIPIVFRIENPSEHFHVPLLLSPFGYSTYRGS